MRMEQLVSKGKKKSKLMEEMIISTTTKSHPNQPTPTFTPWKHYHNPIFTRHQAPSPPYKIQRQQCCNCTQISTHRQRRSTDLSFNMAAAANNHSTKSEKTELESAKAEIVELKAELEFERKLRKKVEFVAKRMSKDLAEERRFRESAERLCDELENRVSHHKVEIQRIEREMEEERRMLRIAEMIREERVHMKLDDANFFYQEKMIILEQNDHQCRKTREEHKLIKVAEENACMGERKSWVSIPPENPHIKRGIIGFVEFPKGLRAVGSNTSNRNYKIECQKTQLRILLKHRNPVQPNSLAIR